MTVRTSENKAHKVSTAVSRHRRRRDKIHFSHFLLQNHVWKRINCFQQYARIVIHIRQKLWDEQHQTADEEDGGSTAVSLPFRGSQKDYSISRWREPHRDTTSGHLTDTDEEPSETGSEPIADDLTKHFCPEHIASCTETHPPLECCITWRRFQKVWYDYNPFDPEDKTTQEDLTFLVHCMWRWPFEMWASDDEGGPKEL